MVATPQRIPPKICRNHSQEVQLFRFLKCNQLGETVTLGRPHIYRKEVSGETVTLGRPHIYQKQIQRQRFTEVHNNNYYIFVP